MKLPGPTPHVYSVDEVLQRLISLAGINHHPVDLKDQQVHDVIGLLKEAIKSDYEKTDNKIIKELRKDIRDLEAEIEELSSQIEEG
jgi:peptidoglycan hydrolase CwlO-like protein